MIKLAGCVITGKQGGILLLHRSDGKREQWEIPGGKIEEKESAEQAASREVKEELGVDVELLGKIGEKSFRMDNQEYSYTWMSASLSGGEPKIMEPHTFDKLGYFTGSQLRVMFDDLSPNTQNFLIHQGGAPQK